VVATGLRFEDIDADEAVELGRLSVLKRLQRQGRLSRRERLCEAAAKRGQLEKLKVLRADGWPWDAVTCSEAARGGHLEVLQWLRANGCPWDKDTLTIARTRGHLEVKKWAMANGCPKW
jgi:hypothetical protein